MPLGILPQGNLIFGKEDRKNLDRVSDFQRDGADEYQGRAFEHPKSAKNQKISLQQLDFMKRAACHSCPDYAAEYANVSFGDVGAKEEWGAVVTRARAIFASTPDNDLCICIFDSGGKPGYPKEPWNELRGRIFSNALNRIATSRNNK